MKYRWTIAQTLLFALSLVLVIPPVPSDDGVHYGFVPLGMLGVMCFIASRLVAHFRGLESLGNVVTQGMLFLIFAVVIYERCQL